MDYIRWIADRQVEFQTAWNIDQYVSSILMFESFAMLFCDKFGIYGIWAMLLYLGAPPICFVIVTLQGILMIRSNYQGAYAKAAANINPDWKKALEKIDNINEVVRKGP